MNRVSALRIRIAAETAQTRWTARNGAPGWSSSGTRLGGLCRVQGCRWATGGLSCAPGADEDAGYIRFDIGAFDSAYLSSTTASAFSGVHLRVSLSRTTPKKTKATPTPWMALIVC